MERSSKARKPVGPIALITAIGVMIAFSVAGIANPLLFYSPDRAAQVSMLNTPDSRKIFTTFFYWYQSRGPDYANSPHVAESWSTNPYPSKVPSDPSKYPAGWPGPTSPAEMVQNNTGTQGWHDSDTYHPPAQAPLYYGNGDVLPGSLKNGTMEHMGSWFDWMNMTWYEWEIRCMMRAGIDVLMPDYWWNGFDNAWAINGTRTLVQAWYDLAGNLRHEGKAANITSAYALLPKIALFYDTTCMKQLYIGHNVSYNNATFNATWAWDHLPGPDLKQVYWQEKFWQNIDAFLQYMDDHCSFYWNNRYVVWLYSAGWFSDIGTSVLQYCRTQCLQKYGHSIYFVGGDDWKKAGVDAICGWGASFGAHEPESTGVIPVGAVGPGYYNLGAIAGQTPLFKVRDPSRYISEWQGLMNAGAMWVHVETWNELHEGTGICWTQEYGYKWIDLTRQMADIFHNMKGYDPYTNFNFIVIIATLGALIVVLGVAGIATRVRRI
ncbi:MAG TPA: hypothetical protein VKM55_25350 [Candidatus Lokiarchaeia archaeon]|nr:hypothetical protein [Candidatus Lokiarchaeia archaeon]